MADSNYAFAPRVLGILLSHLGRHEEARASIRRARELDPLSAMNRALSSQIDFAAGDADGAVRYAREAIIIDPEFWIGHLQLAQAYVELQATAAHSNLLPRQAGSAAETAGHSPCEAIGLGQADCAFDWLLRALEAHDVHLIFLTIDPKWNPMRSQSRFKDLIARCGFSKQTDGS